MTEKATFAAGCFWGVEVDFRNTPGVTDVQVGYTGGTTEQPTYKQVCSGGTGHAEAVEVTFDPSEVTYEELVDEFWGLHDPTQVNRQGPDAGPSYRSAIFPQNAEQRRLAAGFITKLRAANRPIATRIESGSFYPAESSHQDFVRRNPLHPYVVVNDRPKLARLKRAYPQYWKA